MTAHSDDSKRVARAFYEGYNGKNLEANFDAYVSRDLVNHALGGAYDRQAWLDFDATLFPAFKDFSLTVLDQVAEGDKVATRLRLGGTQTGEFAGIPPSGNMAFNHATTVDRIENGKIVEHWADMDFSGFLQQLTAGPTPETYNEKEAVS
jgi:predicted ester cyclase